MHHFFICVAWLVDLCDMTRCWFIWATPLIHVYNESTTCACVVCVCVSIRVTIDWDCMTWQALGASHVCHDSLIAVTSRSFICVTWHSRDAHVDALATPIYMCDMALIHMSDIHKCVMWHLFICVTWHSFVCVAFICVWRGAYSYVWRGRCLMDTWMRLQYLFICVTWHSFVCVTWQALDGNAAACSPCLPRLIRMCDMAHSLRDMTQ